MHSMLILIYFTSIDTVLVVAPYPVLIVDLSHQSLFQFAFVN